MFCSKINNRMPENMDAAINNTKLKLNPNDRSRGTEAGNTSVTNQVLLFKAYLYCSLPTLYLHTWKYLSV